ncbi:MAG TPA: hypothetical protein VER37_07455 [Thermomicrobiales bacterium]|nr:hypothetical protein [Thermomicrobiales bacterium]
MRDPDDAGDVGLEDLAGVGAGDPGRLFPGARDPGVVNEHVEMPLAPLQLVRRRRDRPLVGDVEPH